MQAIHNTLPSDIEYRLKLYACEHIGPSRYQKLLDFFGSAEQSLLASSDTLQKAGLNKAQIDALKTPDLALLESTLNWLQIPENHVLFLDQDEYPSILKQLENAPPLLFTKGDWSLLNEPQIAMVGSRNATKAGKDIAFNFAADLSKHGLLVTSGLASGIDSASHEGALSTRLGKTVAVVGTGLDRIYPAINKALAEQIVSSGVIVSEFNLGTRPHPGNFPRRNRIISGLSVGTLVVEAAAKSGSLITSQHAIEQGKDVFAIPGSIHSPLSKGCHQLIRQGAKLVETVDDLLFDLQAQLASYINDSEAGSPTSKTRSKPDVMLDNSQKTLLEAIDYEPTAPDEMIQRTGFASEEISSMLLILELKELIESENGFYYRKQ